MCVKRSHTHYTFDPPESHIASSSNASMCRVDGVEACAITKHRFLCRIQTKAMKEAWRRKHQKSIVLTYLNYDFFLFIWKKKTFHLLCDECCRFDRSYTITARDLSQSHSVYATNFNEFLSILRLLPNSAYGLVFEELSPKETHSQANDAYTVCYLPRTHNRHVTTISFVRICRREWERKKENRPSRLRLWYRCENDSFSPIHKVCV